MTEQINNNAEQVNNANDEGPILHIIGQYIKDFSFENPRAPQSLTPNNNAPEINININVQNNDLGDNKYECILSLSAQASIKEDILFQIELAYAGVFQLANVPEEHIVPIMFIEAPRLIFPFARQILANTTRDGGFPPLLLDPIDFALLFQQRLANEQTAAEPVKH